MKGWIRGLLAGLAGGVAWLVGIFLVFGPAQTVLADPELQSAKMIAAFTSGPPPRMSEAPWLLVLALLKIGVLWGWVYVWLSRGWPDPWWKRGLRFAVVGWVLMVPWFAFYLPYNVLWEPLALVALEGVCWAGVMTLVGLAIAGVDAVIRRRG